MVLLEDLYSSEIQIKNISEPKSKWLSVEDELYEFVEYINKTNKSMSDFPLETMFSHNTLPKTLKISNKFAVSLIRRWSNLR